MKGKSALIVLLAVLVSLSSFIEAQEQKAFFQQGQIATDDFYSLKLYLFSSHQDRRKYAGNPTAQGCDHSNITELTTTFNPGDTVYALYSVGYKSFSSYFFDYNFSQIDRTEIGQGSEDSKHEIPNKNCDDWSIDFEIPPESVQGNYIINGYLKPYNQSGIKETYLANNRAEKIITVVGASQPINVPENNPLIVVLVGLIVVLLAGKPKKSKLTHSR